MADIDCSDPAVLKGAYGYAVCKSVTLNGITQAELQRRQAEMEAAGWSGGGWNVYQAALARRNGVPAPAPAAPTFPWVQLGAAALAVGAGVWWWRR